MNKNQINKSRPTSPHLSIYKPQINSVLSIMHRISGVGLFIVLLIFCWWFIAWSFDDFSPCYLAVFDNCFVIGLLVIASYGFFYHLCAGIRHLVWDIGFGYSIRDVNRYGLVVLIASVVLTACFWACIL